MQRARGVSWFTVLCALCTLQCAELKPFDDFCGNGAVDPRDEDCDRKSFIVDATAGRGTPQCGEPGSGASACHFLCGTGANDPKCPTEDWACRQGVCVALEAGDGKTAAGVKRYGLASPVAVVGPAAAAHVADFDGDKVDEIVAIPVSVGSPLVVHFSPLDATRSKMATLFPAPASAVVSAPLGKPARLVAALEDGTQVTVARSSTGPNGERTRELESEVVATTELNAASVDILLRRTRSDANAVFVWVHGDAGPGKDPLDSLHRLPLGRRRIGTDIAAILTMFAVDAHDKPLTKRRVALGILPDKKATCGRIAVFTNDEDVRGAGTLDIITPDKTNCAWENFGRVTLSGKFPIARGPNGVFAADLKGDGVYDLIVNSFASVTPARPMTFVLHDMQGNFVPLFDEGGTDTAVSLALAAAAATGSAPPALVVCERQGNTVDPCFGPSAAGSAATFGLRFPKQDPTKYSDAATLRSGQVLSTGFADLNGDGRQDVWAWFEEDTGVRVFEATPQGFFPGQLLEHGSRVLRGTATGPLDSTSPDDLLAVAEVESGGGGAGFTSTLLVTSGGPNMAAMTPKAVARLTGRSSPTFVAEPPPPG